MFLLFFYTVLRVCSLECHIDLCINPVFGVALFKFWDKCFDSQRTSLIFDIHLCKMWHLFAATVHVDYRLSPLWRHWVDIMPLCLSLLSLCPTVCFACSKMPLYVSLVASILVSMATQFTNTSLAPNDPVLLLSFSLLCVEVFSFGD